jgi:hypothetical protein
VPIDIAALIEKGDASAFRRILPKAGQLGSTPANRILLPGSGSARKEIANYVGMLGSDLAVLQSHALTPEILDNLLNFDTEEFFRDRSAAIVAAVDRLSDRLAGWSRTDRPSISYLLQRAEAED